MKVKINIFLRKLSGILFLVLLLSSCVEEYWPELKESHDSSLVVDGKITNLPGPYIVKLSQSISMQDSVFSPKVGATVKIIDSEGNVEFLIEAIPGEYQTSNQDFIGIIGRSYKVQIITADGKEYASGFEELKEPTPIESVSYEEKEKVIDETTSLTEDGFQFYVSSELSANEIDYFYWEAIETYEYHADYRIEQYYDPSDGSRSKRPATDFHRSLYDCWTTSIVKGFFTLSTEQLSIPKVVNEPLHFIGFSNDKIKLGYSLLMKQYTISEQAHLFLKGLKEQNSDQHNFYTNQPYQVRGNVSNVTDHEEAVLGYFMVASVAEPKRIFARKYHSMHIPGYEVRCGNYFYKAEDIRDLLYESNHSNRILYFTTLIIEMYGGFSGNDVFYYELLSYVEDTCVDCRIKGGSNIKPKFWINFN